MICRLTLTLVTANVSQDTRTGKGGSAMGQPVAFFEVVSQDAPRAQKFYADLFGWQVAADPAMGGYALVDTGAGEDAIGGGIRTAGEPRRGAVQNYFRGGEPGRSFCPAGKPRRAKRLAPTPPPPGYCRL